MCTEISDRSHIKSTAWRPACRLFKNAEISAHHSRSRFSKKNRLIELQRLAERARAIIIGKWVFNRLTESKVIVVADIEKSVLV